MDRDIALRSQRTRGAGARAAEVSRRPGTQIFTRLTSHLVSREIKAGSSCPPRTPNSCPLGIVEHRRIIPARSRDERSGRLGLESRHLKIRLRKQIDEARSLQHHEFPTRVLVSEGLRPLERIVL
jgi:hypothetical protein